jgi:hypothetical protein
MASKNKPQADRGDETTRFTRTSGPAAGPECPFGVIHVIPAIPACPVRPKSGRSAIARVYEYTP